MAWFRVRPWPPDQPDPQSRESCLETRLVDLGVGRQDDHLVAGVRKIPLDQMPAMDAVQASHGRVDDRRQRPRRRLGQAPQDRDRENLLLALRQPLLGDRLPSGVEQADRKRRRIDLDAMHQAFLAQQEAERIRDQPRQPIDLARGGPPARANSSSTSAMKRIFSASKKNSCEMPSGISSSTRSCQLSDSHRSGRPSRDTRTRSRAVLPPPLIPPTSTIGDACPLRRAGVKSNTCSPRYKQKLRSVSCWRIMAG